ncbi:MAG TPA: hypothetical protein VJI98_00815 [Candidatus Nanoarchaeia archaeon]|nr:hypothetical protein [Candidatus Nanoarchaeia archaeon]
MEIKDIKANQGNIDLVLDVVEKEEPRTFEKFGKQGRVCNAKVKDSSGMIKLTLWNEDADKINVGDKIHLENGWCSEYKDEKQLSTGKFGKIEVVSAAQKEVLTNDPGILQEESEEMSDGDDDLDEIAEELVEE